MKHGAHHSYDVDLKGVDNATSWEEDGQEYIMAKIEDSHEIALQLFNAVHKISKEHEHCSLCGGVVPELRVKWGDKEFRFTCTKVTEGRETLFETDYKKLAEYLSQVSLSK